MEYIILIEMKFDTWVQAEIEMPKLGENRKNVKNSNLDVKRFDCIMNPNKETSNSDSRCMLQPN